MNRRFLGSTGLRVSQIGLGTWPLAGNGGIPGYGALDPEGSEAVVRTAVETGVTLFDTADVYGAGFAERLLGDLLAPLGRGVVVVTKGGWNLELGEFDGRPQFLRQRVLASRERLRREALDVYLLHNPPARLLGLQELYRPLLELRDQGLIRHVGVSVARVEDAWLTLDRPELEIVQLPYNLLLSEADQGLLQRLHTAGKGILVREALGNGLLSGKYRARSRFSSEDFRSRWPAEVLQAASEAMMTWGPYRRPGEPWVHFALRFVLDRPEVSAVLVGAHSPPQIAPLAAAGNLALPPVEDQRAPLVPTPR